MTTEYQIGQKLEPLVRPSRPAPGNERWHVVRLRTGSEQKAVKFLKRYQFGIYAPLTRVWRPVAQRHMSHAQRASGAVVKRPKDIPVFPGYMFLRFDINRSDWHGVFDHLGISGLLCNGDLPTVITDKEIQRVRGLEIEGVIPGTTEMVKVLFNVGETVLVTDGPFASFPGVIEELPVDLAERLKTHTIEELDDSFRARVAVNIFGRATPVDLAFTQIAKI